MEVQKNDVKLEPCPFCGSTDVIAASGDVCFNGGLTWNYNTVRCQKCNGMVLVGRKENAVDVWNNRATTD